MRDFIGIAAKVARSKPGLNACLPVIEKELLHLDILRAMHDAGHLRQLTFKGGTCLRLCHGGLRFSEDLDFSGGINFDPAFLDDIERVLRTRIGERYGLEVSVAPPKLADGRTRTANRWVARVVTRPASRRANLGVQRIKIEIDDRNPGMDSAPLRIQCRHQLIADDFVGFFIPCASLSDVCTDKMIALPLSVLQRDNPRYRDAWDLAWLADRVAGPKELAERAAEKAAARNVPPEALRDALQLTSEQSATLAESVGFQSTLGRFLPSDLAAGTIGNPQFREMLAMTVKSYCDATLEALNSGPRAPYD